MQFGAAVGIGMTKKMIQQILIVAAILLVLPPGITYLLSREEISQDKEQSDIELYLPLILCRQIPWDYEEEMLKAQAVLARSSLYLYYQENPEKAGDAEATGDVEKAGNAEKTGDAESAGDTEKVESVDSVSADSLSESDSIVDTEVQQYDEKYFRELLKEYRSHARQHAYRNAYEKMKRAVEDTEGVILMAQGNVCEGVFHQISAGTTRDGDWLAGKAAMYLHSVDSSQDTTAENYLNGHDFTEEALRLRLLELYPNVILEENAAQEQIKIIEKDEQGYALTVRVGNLYLSGEQFRCDLELSSSNFVVQETDGKICFLCKGIGHGFGLSQYGGNELAKKGFDYEVILETYFPDAILAKKNET